MSMGFYIRGHETRGRWALACTFQNKNTIAQRDRTTIADRPTAAYYIPFAIKVSAIMNKFMDVRFRSWAAVQIFRIFHPCGAAALVGQQKIPRARACVCIASRDDCMRNQPRTNRISHTIAGSLFLFTRFVLFGMKCRFDSFSHHTDSLFHCYYYVPVGEL